MMRFRIALFFVAIAWVSLFAPAFGGEVVHSMDRSKLSTRDAGPGVVLALLVAAVLLASALGWVVILVAKGGVL